jgi:hypothetical protein
LTRRFDDETVVVSSEVAMMHGRSAGPALMRMNDSDNDVIVIVTERFERRLTEETSALRMESSALRVEMATGFGEVRTQIAQLRAEMIDRNSELLKWGLVFGVGQTAAIATLLALLR